MAMDETDRRLVNGLIVGVVVAGIVYFYPFDWPIPGYSRQADLQQGARESLVKLKGPYERNYAPMHPTNFGDSSTEKISASADVADLASLRHYFKQANDATDALLEQKESVNRMSFPPYTEIPLAERTEKEAGLYFRKVWDKKKLSVQDNCRVHGVILDDDEIGFAHRFKNVLPGLEKSKELLREMHITETIIDLCVKAKVAQETAERNSGKQPEAYMRIMETEPKDSEPTGPTALRLNPKFDPGEKNPASPNFRKYIVESWPSFVQEYPVEIQLMCDYNSFVRFLHSIRTVQGQFLVIRQLEILSPAIVESHSDISEAKVFKPATEGSPSDTTPKKWPTRPEQIVVTIIASGMDFFDPKEMPDGFYKPKKVEDKGVRRQHRRTLGTAPAVKTEQ